MEKLAIASFDPFDPRATNAYIPGGSCTKSWKDTAVVKFDAVTDSNGRFMAIMNPSPCKDMPCVWYSNNTNGNVMTGLIDPGLLDSSVSAGTLTFSSSDLFSSDATGSAGSAYYNPPNVRARIVSAALKITFATSTLYDGGTCYSLVEPNHENLYNCTQQFIQNYPSCKTQRVTMRDEIEMVMIPTTREMAEFSPTLDDINVTPSFGIISCSGQFGITAGSGTGASPNTYSPAIYTNVLNSDPFAQGTPYTTLSSFGAANKLVISDPSVLGKNISCLLYPYSRKNQVVTQSDYEGGISSEFSVSTTGVVTFTGSAPLVQYSGCQCVVGSTLSGYLVYQNYGGTTEWRFFGPHGGLSGELAVQTYTLCPFMVWPSVPAVAILEGAGAGQSVHCDYIIHVEYSGINVTAKSDVNPPSAHAMSLVHAAVNHARDLSGQSERMTLKHVVKEAFHAVDSSAGKQVVNRAISAVLGGNNSLAPFVNMGLDSVAKRVRNW